jgi:hypothetical protein
MKRPLRNASEITRGSIVAAAVDALLYGDDEAPRDTKARGWDEEGVNAMRNWFEDLADIDRVISENVEVSMTALPTAGLVERLEAAVENVSTWYAAPIPVFQKRLVHIHYNELAEIEGDLRGGKINPAEAEARFAIVMADLGQIESYSKFMGD